ncbi:50S ribosomal protein L4 [Acetobacterium wieringae]|jgi:large subunit ribosomal protein L4|uniref:Large ribosomal subunit protein uL4 n=1 Tax=Acetobacterium wieringae TaxID=52694 RepID=A0A5D0WNM9_9FIRM|nr:MULTISPECIES: 50S ribosomal protein L4 [Acetobacterium]MEA4806636.1 50S ribosomal protein L4 [Acetobacterium wieringae]OXS24721.1 MAG: 50S ribosomal protein L4 [Acetobacterium sp. MES1]TYC85643.1 50S ribosomal protein L4 [Acetobacterium wieringae]URN85023.1 50S ribosomal protein L4 [Acetobacterium wieringae]UYO63489.1 50S ribosomal protein L4 [Acetobacterium wieringae]
MPKIDVLDVKGNVVGDVELSEGIFGIEPNEHVVHEVVVALLANRRQGTRSALTRSEVRGGGRKPWRQKGTGRARAGTIRSPLWKGGGVIFAPKSRDYSKKVNKKVKALAMKSVFSAKAQDNELRVLNQLVMDAPKTKEMVAVLNNINAQKALIVLPENNEAIIRSANNIPKVATTTVSELNVYDMLKYDVLIMTQESLQKIEEVYA